MIKINKAKKQKKTNKQKDKCSTDYTNLHNMLSHARYLTTKYLKEKRVFV